MPNQGVGVSVPRKEDDRYLRGREHLTANANCREHHYVITGV
jgi:hypothetical protein